MTKQERLDALEEAIDEGVLTAEYGDKSVRYRSLDEMLRIRDRLRAELGKTGSNRRFAAFNKGLK